MMVFYGVNAIQVGDPLKSKPRSSSVADGVESGCQAGIDTTLNLKDIESCAQFLVLDPGIDDDYTRLLLGRALLLQGTPGPFPKGEKRPTSDWESLEADPGPVKPSVCCGNLQKSISNGKIVEMVVEEIPAPGPSSRPLLTALCWLEMPPARPIH